MWGWRCADGALLVAHIGALAPTWLASLAGVAVLGASTQQRRGAAARGGLADSAAAGLYLSWRQQELLTCSDAPAGKLRRGDVHVCVWHASELGACSASLGSDGWSVLLYRMQAVAQAPTATAAVARATPAVHNAVLLVAAGAAAQMHGAFLSVSAWLPQCWLIVAARNSLLWTQIMGKLRDLALLSGALQAQLGPRASESGTAVMDAAGRLALDAALGCFLLALRPSLLSSPALQCTRQLSLLHGAHWLPGAVTTLLSASPPPPLSAVLAGRFLALTLGTARAAESACAALSLSFGGGLLMLLRALALVGVSLPLAAAGDAAALATLHLALAAVQLSSLLSRGCSLACALYRVATGASRSALAGGRVHAVPHDAAQVTLACLMLACASVVLPTLAVWAAAAGLVAAARAAARAALAALLDAAKDARAGLLIGGSWRAARSCELRLRPLEHSAHRDGIMWWELRARGAY